MNELHKSETVIQKRKQQRKEQGFWICEQCGTKYYLGVNCDLCLEKEFREVVKKLERK